MSEARVRVTGRLVLGLIVIALGALFTLDNLGVLEAGDVLQWWPVTLIAYGLARMAGVLCQRRTALGVVFTLAGSWFLLHNLGYVRFGLGDLWPLVLVLLGVSMVSRAMNRTREARGGEDLSSNLSAFALWSGTGRKVVAQDFRGGDVTAIMGGHDIDLRGAGIAGDAAVIDLFVIWGGVEIKVPPDWKVSCEALPIMGGVDDRSKAPAGEARGHLVLKGLIVMGGVEIKN